MSYYNDREEALYEFDKLLSRFKLSLQSYTPEKDICIIAIDEKGKTFEFSSTVWNWLWPILDEVH